jgi:ADP-ribose pyrophosphatase
VDPDTVLLVGQYRYVAGDFFWEMPTGAQHAGEGPIEAAQRELGEEAGYEAGRLVALGDFHTSKSILREVAHLYLAEDLRPATRPPDPTEFIERRAFPFAEVLAMVERGEIKDAMTIIAVLRAARRRPI